jgi:hypothetical protein
MEKPTLSKDEQERMTSRGWDAENPATVAKYLEFRESVTAGRLDEGELNKKMNILENQQAVKERSGKDAPEPSGKNAAEPTHNVESVRSTGWTQYGDMPSQQRSALEYAADKQGQRQELAQKSPEKGENGQASEKENRIRELAERFSTNPKSQERDRDREPER